MQRRPLLPLLLLLPTVAVASDPPGWTDPVPAEALGAYLEPLELPVRRGEAFRRVVADLSGRAAWSDLARRIDARLQDDGLRGSLIAPARPDAAWLGALPDAARRLRHLPEPLLRAYRQIKEPEVQELLEAGALSELISRIPGSEHAPRAARRLGERALERGDVEAACLHWRTSLALDSSQELLRRRLIAARARPTVAPARPGALGVALPRPAAPTLRWLRSEPHPAGAHRPLSADERCVFFTVRDAVLACERSSGRLRWRLPLRAVRGLSLGARLIARTQRELIAIDRDRGASVWRLPLTQLGAKGDLLSEDGFASATAWGDDTVTLAAVSGRWVLAAIDRHGELRWKTRLWERRSEPYIYSPLVAVFSAQADTCRNPEDEDGACPGRHGPSNVHPERAPVGVQVRASGPRRRVRGDGALAVLGDRVFVTADGVVFAASLARGELLWLRARLRGLAVDGSGTVHVGLRASAYAVEAETAAGLFARLDPLDGRTLDVPARPAAALYRPVYRLGDDPLVLGWGPDAAALSLGAERAAFGRSQPLGPGASWAGHLALPTEEGLELWDLVRGASERIAWPAAPARPIAVPGGLVLAGAEQVALLDPDPKPPASKPPASPSLDDLDAADWRTRVAARQALRAALSEGDAALRERLRAASQTGSLERRLACASLLDLAERGDRWRAICPEAPGEALNQLLLAPTAERVRAVRPHVAKTPAAARALKQVFVDADEASLQLAVLEHLLSLDRATQGALVATTRTSDDAGAQRAGADLIVALARDGVPFPLKMLMRDSDLWTPPDGAGLRSLVAAGDPELYERFKPKDLEHVGHLELMLFFKSNPGPTPNPDALIERLLPIVRKGLTRGPK